MIDIQSDIEERLKELRSRIAQDPARAATLQPVVESLEAVLANFKHNQAETAARLRALEYDQTVLNRRVESIENSLIFRFLRRAGAPLLYWRDKIDALWRQSLLYREASSDPVYERWLLRHGQDQNRESPMLVRKPLFTITMRLQDAPREFLEQAVDSVVRQSYPHWELYVPVTGGWADQYLTELGMKEPRIRLRGPEQCSRGEYIAFFDAHDALAPRALEYVAKAVQGDPVDLIYTDEDRLNEEGRRVDPIFKPDWSPDLLLSCDYIGHLMVVSRGAIDRVGGLRDGLPGAEEYDLALRVTDQSATVRHIPEVLYHARSRRDSGERHIAGQRALEDTIRRRGWRATVAGASKSGRHRIRWQNRQEPLVSLIVCSRSPKLLRACLASIRKRTVYNCRELVVVQHVSGDADRAMDDVVAEFCAKCVRYVGPFHYSRMNNLGAEAATGEILVFLNDDVEPMVDSWLTDLVAQAQRPEIGVVGARLLYPNGAIQHAGVAIGIGDGCGHVGRGANTKKYWHWLDVTRNVSAVTGACLAVRKPLFQEVGGFDARFPINYNDVDLCLRIARSGYRVLYESWVVLKHYECQTRRGGVAAAERQQWYSCWADEVDRGDPFYTPNLTRVTEAASLGD